MGSVDADLERILVGEAATEFILANRVITMAQQSMFVGAPRHAPPHAAFAWQVHGALEAWGARVDVKVSILLAYQGGGFVLGVTSMDSVRSVAGPWSLVLAAAQCALLLAMCVGAAAMVPVLGSARRLRRERRRNWIYFGHVRTWNAPDLARRLADMTAEDEIAMLCQQLVALSRINWRKHRLLQVSVILALIAMAIGTSAIVAALS